MSNTFNVSRKDAEGFVTSESRSEIMEIVDSLQAVADDLNGTILDLEKRLYLILREKQDSFEDQSYNEIEPNTPLSTELTSIRGLLIRSIMVVSSIRSRLEV